MRQFELNHPPQLAPRPMTRKSPNQVSQRAPRRSSYQVPHEVPQPSRRHNHLSIAIVLIAGLLGQLILLSACTAMPVDSTKSTKGPVTDRANVTQSAGSDGVKYSYEFTGAFDTVIQLIGYAPDKPTFDRWAKAAEQQFRELHQLYDAYHVYSGIKNIKTINDQAGKSPVVVEKRIMDLLVNTRKWRTELSKVIDLTIGPVVSLWAEYRTIALADPEKGSPPTEERLASAMLLMGADELALDLQAQTVYLPRVGMKLDVGAVAKGYATELVAQTLMTSGVTSMIINAGGSSVRMIGKPANPERKTWNIAIQNPEVLLPSQEYIPQTAEPTLTVIRTTDTSVVTSGDYQRYYNVEDQIYHHLINPEDGQPARYYRAVTVMTRDSGLADFLSTALFLLPYDQSRELVDSLPDVAALWVFADGQVELTPKMAAVADPLADLNRG
jgi:thiamine biosynthesis lipoprotein